MTEKEHAAETPTTDAASDYFDRMLGRFKDMQDAVKTKESTIRLTPTFGVGRSQTYIVQTVRVKAEGDYIFIEHVSHGRTLRVVLPPEVSDRIANQRESVNAKVRSKAAKEVAADRKSRGLEPAFMKRRKAR